MVIPLEAPDVQRVSMRRAYHAGARALIRQLGLAGLLHQIDTGTLTSAAPDVMTVDPEELLALHRELMAFNEAVKRGTA